MANLILIGLRGSGKTTVGRLLGQRLGRSFIDLDEVTARDLGYSSVAQAWKGRGLSRFRNTEVAVLRDTLRTDNQVVSLGGGTPTAPGAELVLNTLRAGKAVRVVYLRADAASLRERLEGTDIASRPTLTGAGALEEIPQVLAERDPLYLRLADVVIQTDNLTPEEVADLVVIYERSA
jgi:shikimate kinase